MTIIVNPHFLSNAVSPWIGGADDDTVDAELCALTLSDEAGARSLVKRDLVPWFAGASATVKEGIRRAIHYVLTEDDRWCEGVLAHGLMPFEVPANSRRLFEIIWEEVTGTSVPQAKWAGQVVLDKDPACLNLR